jgi:hypothetical protein
LTVHDHAVCAFTIARSTQLLATAIGVVGIATLDRGDTGESVTLWEAPAVVPGAAAAATGIALSIAGAWPVPVECQKEGEAAVPVEPLIGPTGGGLLVRF